MSELFGDTWISLKYIKRYPNSARTKSWYGKIVAISCCSGYYRSGFSGYTYRPNAAAYSFEDAIKSTMAGGSERMNMIHLHSTISDENHNFDPSGRRSNL